MLEKTALSPSRGWKRNYTRGSTVLQLAFYHVRTVHRLDTATGSEVIVRGVTPSAILAFLTGSRGAFNLVPTATAWLIKDIGLVFVAGSLLLVDQELTLDVCDLVFRCLSSFVSAALLASLMDKKPRVFECCYWAHMGCVPIDLALAAAYVVFREDMGSSTSDEHLIAARRATVAPRGLELNVTVANGTDAAAADGASSGTGRLQTTGHAGVNPLFFALWQLVRLKRSGGGTDPVTQLAGIKVSDLQNPLTVFLVVDHAVSVVARSHLVWRMNGCLRALVHNQVALGNTAAVAAAAAAGLEGDAGGARAGTEAMYPVLFLPGDAPEEASSTEEEKQRRLSLRIAIARQQRDLQDVMRTPSSSSIVLTAHRRKP
ncbi:hypothetical protein MTO96_014184 [Rhipicephalus appendiculatus]